TIVDDADRALAGESDCSAGQRFASGECQAPSYSTPLVRKQFVTRSSPSLVDLRFVGRRFESLSLVHQSTEAESSQPRWKNPTKLSYVSLEFVVQTSADDVALVVGFKLIPVCIY